MLTQSRLKNLLTYDPNTGLFRRRVISGPTVKVGDVAGSIKTNGYCDIRVDGRMYKAHRLAFLYMEGVMPPAFVDHINGDRADNRWCNLRHATRSQNAANTNVRSDSHIGVKGANKRPSGRFAARVQVNGMRVWLGTFDTAEEASAAYEHAANDAFGPFARANQ